MKELINTYPAMAWSLVSVLLAAIVIMVLWQRVKWWWMNAWYAFPLVGATASLARDPGRANDEGWLKSELKLCRDYKRFLRVRDEHDFLEKVSYLTKAGDLGRRATPSLIWILTIALVFVEAMGFSYVLAGYTVPGASENVQQLGALGIAFMISVLLVAFTHFAGHELYVSGKIAQARQRWNEGGRTHDLSTGEIALATPQARDDELPGYTQLANRVGSHAKYVVTIGTAIFVLIVAVGATYVRGQVLQKTLHQSTTGTQGLAGRSGGGMDMNAIQLPTTDAKASVDAEAKAHEDENAIDERGGWGTFIVLAVIFVFLQLLGVLFGFKWGFAGKESHQAFKAIGEGRYASYADVRADAAEIVDRAQAQLEGLQQRVQHRNGETGIRGVSAANTFKQFLHKERIAEQEDRRSEQAHRFQSAEVVKGDLHQHASQGTAPGPVGMVPPAAMPSVPSAVSTAPSAPAAPIAPIAPIAPTAPTASQPPSPDMGDDDTEIEQLKQQLAQKQAQQAAQRQAQSDAEAAATVAAETRKAAKEAELHRLRAELAQLEKKDTA